MISRGTKSEDYIDISNIRQADIAAYYLGIKSIPCLIKSPLRQDNRPSFSLFSNNGEEVGFIDYSTREHGGIIDLLMKMWNCNYVEAKRRIANDMGDCKLNISIGKGSYSSRISIKSNSGIDLKCKIREWKDYDLEYWGSYGITLKWLKYADVYPISHKIVVKDNISYAFAADKYAYAYVEFKEGNTTLKIYQPFNKKGYKWSNSHDKSVISLWTKIPYSADKLVICSSLKDALTLWANSNIPAIALQGEGYGMSNTVISELKNRFGKVYICLDNDDVGISDAKVLASKTGFTNIVLPPFKGGKDLADYRQLYGKEQFNKLVLNLFSNE